MIIGCVSQAGEQGANIARNAVLAAGWPTAVTGATVNRFCGSGLQAVNLAAMGVAAGAQDLVVAGGVESMSRTPMGADGGGLDGGNLHLRPQHFQVPQGMKAGMTAANIDLWEINEAFAAVVLQTMAALDELERRGLATALITLCIGGGQGVATIIEQV